MHVCNASGIAHLTCLNPYIQGVIRSASKSTGGAGAPMGMPRQRGAQVSIATPSTSQQPAIGTSGFAFQGTNGHVIVQRVVGGGSTGGASHADVGGMRSSLAILDRQRYWTIPETHALLRRVRATSSDRCVAMAVLDARVHAGLWDHRIMDRALFPGAGFLELSLCGACMMGGASNTTPHWEIAVVEGSVPVPLVLSEEKETVTIEWGTDSGGETISLSSSAARVTPHLRAKLRRIVQQQQVASGAKALPSPSSTTTVSASASMRDLLTVSDAVFDNGARMASARHVATGVITERSDNFAPYHTHPASLDNALQLAAACYVPSSSATASATSDGGGGAGGGASLMVPAGFRGYSAPTKNSSGATTLRATAEIHQEDGGSVEGDGGGATGGRHAPQGRKSQSSSHALLDSSGVLLARVKELEACRVQSQMIGGMLADQLRTGAGATRPVQGGVRGLGEEVSDEDAASSLAIRRHVLYRVEWDAAPHRPETASPTTAFGRLALQSSSPSSSSSVRVTAGAIQALQVRAAGGGAAATSVALCTRGCHPQRSSISAPGKISKLNSNL